MLVDDVVIDIKAGNGGNGKVSFRRNGQTAKGGPDGGNGGVGGNIHIQGVDDLTALNVFRFKKKWKADDGIGGGKNNLYGRKGNDLILKLPIGTDIVDIQTGEAFHVISKHDRFLIAKGGVGGLGNNEFKSATNQTPRFAEKGEEGQERTLHLVLRLIADIGLIGLPNAGKSSLLKAITNANPKIGNYPFTTIEPNLGVCDGIVLADIPGLIEGASKGKGLGITFLKHIEKTKVLFHCLDVTSDNLRNDYETVRNEFKGYSDELLAKESIILLTKIDLVTEKILTQRIEEIKQINKPIYSVSIYDEKSLTKLKDVILRVGMP